MHFQPSLPAGTVILDEVLHEMAAHLTTHEPERGGLIFGPRGQKLVTHFVPDKAAEYRATTYTPSANICMLSPRIEREHGLEYKGVIHSHPGSMSHPSIPDIANARKALRNNPHLACFLMPIVTLGDFNAEALGDHEILIPGGKLSHWLVPQVLPTQGRGLLPERISTISLWTDLNGLSTAMQSATKPGKATMLDMEGVITVAYTMEREDGIWLFAAGAGYPFTPPLVVSPDSRPASIAWDMNLESGRRLSAAMMPHFSEKTADASEKPAPSNLG